MTDTSTDPVYPLTHQERLAALYGAPLTPDLTDDLEARIQRELDRGEALTRGLAVLPWTP